MTDLRKTIPITLKGLQFITLVVIAMTFSPIAHAQTDTLQYIEEIQQDSMVQYLTPLEYAFMMHEETKWMFKVNFAYSNAMGSFRNALGFEYALGKAFSLGSGIGFGFKKEDFSNSANNFKSSEFSAFLETRWYYNMKKRMAQYKSKRNLSGNYFGLGIRYARVSRNFFGEFITNGTDSIVAITLKDITGFVSIYAKWGMQRRFLKRGYFDFGLNSGVEIETGRSNTSVFLSSYIDAGLVFAKDKQKIDHDKICPVLKCYAFDKFILKTNLLGLFSIRTGNFGFATTFNPEINAEYKFGSSPFSINGGMGLKLFYSDLNKGDDSNFEYEIKPKIETRWYYNLNKRMIKGKTGNGFSANYLAFGGLYKYSKNPTIFVITSSDFDNLLPDKQIDLGLYLLWGIQRTYSKHFYFDVSFGFFGGNRKNYIKSQIDYDQFLFQPVIKFAIGYRF